MLDLIRKLWQTACLDQPERPSCKVQDGNFVFTVNGNKAKWAELTKLSGIPSHALTQIDGDTMTCLRAD